MDNRSSSASLVLGLNTTEIQWRLTGTAMRMQVALNQTCSLGLLFDTLFMPASSTLPTASNDATSSDRDWLETLLLSARTAAAIGECIPAPAGGIVRGVFGTAIIILEQLHVSAHFPAR